MITNAWYVAGFSDDFRAGELHGPTIAGKSLVMWRTRDDRVVAFDGRCRHKRFPLAKGRLLDDDVLECAYHGFCYSAAGACVSAPAKGSEGPPKNANLAVYPVVERDGLVWLWPGDPERAADVGVPATDELTDPNWTTVRSDPIDAPANWRLLIENLLDITHFYPLHEKNIGDYANSKIPVKIERRNVDGNETIRTIRHVEDYQLPPMLKEWFGYEVVDRDHTHHMLNPSLTRVQMRVAPPGGLGTDAEKGYIIHHIHYPVDKTNLRWWWAVSCETRWRHPHDDTKSLADKVTEGFPSVVAEDLWALEEQQRMMTHADDGYHEVHIKTDGAVVLLRRILEELELREKQPDGNEIELLRTGRVSVES